MYGLRNTPASYSDRQCRKPVFFFFFLQHQLNGTGNCSGFSDCIQMHQKRISVGLERITSYMAYVSMHLEQRPGSRSGAKTVNAVISGLNLH